VVDAQNAAINPVVSVTLSQLETDFPGIIAQMTAIADHYNPYK
jgi:hypothetical protein